MGAYDRQSETQMVSLGWTTREAFSEARRQARRSRTLSVRVTANTQIKFPMPAMLPMTLRYAKAVVPQDNGPL